MKSKIMNDSLNSKVVDARGETFEEVATLDGSRCKKCAFSQYDPVFDCLADEYGMPSCEDRLDGTTVYFKKVS